MDKRCQIFYKKCISNLFVLITLRIKMQHMNKEILIYNIFASLKGMCVYKKKRSDENGKLRQTKTDFSRCLWQQTTYALYGIYVLSFCVRFVK